MNWMKIAIILGGAVLWCKFFKWIPTLKRKISGAGEETGLSDKDRLNEAIASNNLDRMIEALDVASDPIDRHTLLSKVVELSYKKRQDSEMKETLKRYAQIHLKEIPEILPALKNMYGESFKEISTFKLLSIALDEEGKYEEAIEVCDTAIRFGFEDGTKTGFHGRIERLKKKAKKSGK